MICLKLYSFTTNLNMFFDLISNWIGTMDKSAWFSAKNIFRLSTWLHINIDDMPGARLFPHKFIHTNDHFSTHTFHTTHTRACYTICLYSTPGLDRFYCRCRITLNKNRDNFQVCNLYFFKADFRCIALSNRLFKLLFLINDPTNFNFSFNSYRISPVVSTTSISLSLKPQHSKFSRE